MSPCEQAQGELSAIQARIRKQVPVGPVSDATVLTPLLESEVGKIKPALYVLFAATGCLLLIACLNIANFWWRAPLHAARSPRSGPRWEEAARDSSGNR